MNRCPNNLLALAVALFLSGGAVFADAVTDGFTAFEKSDFPAAVRAFETAVSANPPSAGLYYNLGLSQRKNDQGPEAAVSFRRALMLDPRMIDARMALSDLERAFGISLAPANWKTILAEKVPLAPLLYGGFTVFWIGAFVFVFAIFRSPARPGQTTAGVVLGVFGAVLFYAAFASDPRYSDRDLAVIGGSGETTLHSVPADRSDLVAKLPAGSPVRLLSQNGAWAYCETTTGARGWTQSSVILPVRPPA